MSPALEFVIIAFVVVVVVIVMVVGLIKLERPDTKRVRLADMKRRDVLILDIEQLANEYRDMDSVLASQIREKIAEFKRKELSS